LDLSNKLHCCFLNLLDLSNKLHCFTIRSSLEWC
jgi:hypothetical protein